MELPNPDACQTNTPPLTDLLDEFFTRHADELFYFCYRRLGDTDAAQDASSRIILKAMRNLDSFTPDPDNPGATFRAWMYRIARNDLIDFQRMHKPMLSLDRMNDDGQPIIHLVAQGPGPEKLLIDREADARVRSMLAKLPETQRTVVELRLAGLRGDEIASTLKMTLSAIKSAQYRAYQRLRILLAADRERER